MTAGLSPGITPTLTQVNLKANDVTSMEMPSKAPTFPVKVVPGSLLTLLGTQKLDVDSPLMKQMHAILITVGGGGSDRV